MRSGYSGGFGLLDMVISLSLSLITIGSLVSIQTYISQVTLTSQQEVDTTLLHLDFYNYLRDPKACKQSLNTFSADDLGSGIYSNPTQIFDTDAATIVFQTNGIYQNGRVQLERMDLGDFEVDNPLIPGAGKAKLKVFLGKLGAPLGVKTMMREIRLQIDRDPAAANKILGCFAIGGYNEIWTQNIDGSIFYNGGGKGYIGVGTDKPQGPVHIATDTVGDQSITFKVVNNDPASNANFTASKARGTIAAKSPVQADDELGGIYGQGWDGSQYITAVDIRTYVDGAVGANDLPGRIEFSTLPAGVCCNTVVRMTVKSSGNVGIGTTAPAHLLDVAGNIRASGCLSDSGGVAAGVCASDKILKTNIQPFALGLEALDWVAYDE